MTVLPNVEGLPHPTGPAVDVGRLDWTRRKPLDGLAQGARRTRAARRDPPAPPAAGNRSTHLITSYGSSLQCISTWLSSSVVREFLLTS